MILIDSNVLVILILGLIDPNLIGKDKRSSIYEKEDFDKLLNGKRPAKYILTA
jgi:hypothetical protein